MTPPRIAAALLALALATGGPALARGSEAEYVVGVDDVLHVIVWDNKDLEQQITVRPDGKISFPLAGELQAAGRSVPQLAQDLKERLATAVKNPQVSVMVKEIRSYRVYVMGRVAKPGVYPIKTGTPVVQALTLAGGTVEGADLSSAYVVRGTEKIPVDLRRLIQDGDLGHNVVLRTEDTLVVPEAASAKSPAEVGGAQIHLLGKLQKPGVYPIKKEMPVLHALFLAGGVLPDANLRGAFLVRGETRTPVDLERLIQRGDLTQNLMLRADDTLVVPDGAEVQNAVFVMGEVRKPGAYPKAESLTLLKLMTLAGGFTDFAAPSRATIVRQDGDKKVQRRINIKDIISDPAANEDVPLRAGDVVVIPPKLF
jgi:polysaccharide export outer membrane protein